MFCEKCGVNINRNGKFCPGCGAEITYKDAHVQGDLQQADQKVKSQRQSVKEDNLCPIMSVWSYLGLFLMAAIPVVGIILTIVFAIKSSNPNKTNYCRAIVLGQVILVALVVLFWSSMATFLYGLL